MYSIAEWIVCAPHMLIGRGSIPGDGFDRPYYESEFTGLDVRSSNNAKGVLTSHKW